MIQYIDLASWVFMIIFIVINMRRMHRLRKLAALSAKNSSLKDEGIQLNRREVCFFCNSLITDPRVTITQNKDLFYVFESGVVVATHAYICQLLEDVLDRAKR